MRGKAFDKSHYGPMPADYAYKAFMWSQKYLPKSAWLNINEYNMDPFFDQIKDIVGNCGAPGEPSISGIFTRDMRPKTAYYALNDLIHREWKTRMTVKAKDGKVSFRGFRGRYHLTWKNADG